MRILIFLLVLLTLPSCKKNDQGVPVMESNPEFLGPWKWGGSFDIATSDRKFLIESNSEGEYFYHGVELETGEGPVSIFENTLQIGSKKFQIDQFPTDIETISDKWKMCKLDGEEYFSSDQMQYTVMASCRPFGICFRNESSSLITATVNDTVVNIDTATWYCHKVATFGSLINYSDNKGNSYSYHAVACEELLVIQ